MSALFVQRIVAPTDLRCSRCENLGIPTPTILACQDCIEFTVDHASTYCCTDCLDRLAEELGNENEE